jgi:hypothetical protein
MGDGHRPDAGLRPLTAAPRRALTNHAPCGTIASQRSSFALASRVPVRPGPSRRNAVHASRPRIGAAGRDCRLTPRRRRWAQATAFRSRRSRAAPIALGPAGSGRPWLAGRAVGWAWAPPGQPTCMLRPPVAHAMTSWSTGPGQSRTRPPAAIRTEMRRAFDFDNRAPRGGSQRSTAPQRSPAVASPAKAGAMTQAVT